MDVFKLPSLLYNACAPIPTFASPTEPIVSPSNALEPIAVFKLPVSLLHNEPAPIAVLFVPVVL